MYTRVAILLLVTICHLLVESRADDAIDDKDRLQGTWEIVKAIEDGQEATEEELEGARVLITKDTVQFKVPKVKGFHFAGRIRLDPDEPLHFDLTDAERGHTYPGIYRYEGNTLTIALHMELSEPRRPRGFEAKEGSDIQLWVLRRKSKL